MIASRPSTRARLLAIGCAIGIAYGCASGGTPASQPPAAAPVITIERKVAWILRLEQQRVVLDAAVGADLRRLATDADPGVRRRAVLALGRIGTDAGLAALTGALSDTDEGVRATAAFALGLLGDPAAAPPLEAALSDPSALVRGRAAEGLGLIAASSSAPAVAKAAASCAALIAPIEPDDEAYPKSPEVEACRLSIQALVRLRQYDELARVVLDDRGQPVSAWWPVAYALQRIGDAKAADALNGLVNTPGVYTAAFAIRGLAGLKDPRVVAPALALAGRADADVRLRAQAIRALGQAGDNRAVASLLALTARPETPRNLVLEALSALGSIGSPRAFDAVLDLFAASSPQVRAAAMAAAARMDPEGFLLVLSSQERDRDWWVRAGLADVLATLPADRVRAALEDLAADPDVRVQAPALRALARIGAPEVDRRAFEALDAPDFGLRAAAAAVVGQRQPMGGDARLAAAYKRGTSDATPTARLAALDALARYQTAVVTETLTEALGDAEWPVRVHAAALLKQRGVSGAAPVRPAPLRQDPAFFETDRLLRPRFSPQAYLETAAGTVQIELDVIDAPITTATFVDLARAGFFNGLRVHRLIPNFVIQAGDPRGDGQGGPGYTIRDEFGLRPFVRGVVGMALGGPETGGSQFFITVSPQPHLDGRYTVFGRVVRGMDLLDGVSQGDVILRVVILDGSGG
jgi:cyclophilin family peptidyl-prolyl cis-trans isomerase/HEAT repeat protein